LNIGGLKIEIPDTLKNIGALDSQLRSARTDAVFKSFDGFSKFNKQFKKATNLSDKESLVVYFGAVAINAAISKYQDSQELKKQFQKGEMELFRKIEEMGEVCLQADAFSERAGELNRALEGTMDAYGKMFVEIYNTLYPPGDESKSKAARAENEDNGGSYFNDDEADAVIQLRTTGQLLLNQVDTKFEGEDDE